MAKQTINQGTAPTGAGGDTFRTGSAKLQANDDELYGFLGANGGDLTIEKARAALGYMPSSGGSFTGAVTTKPAALLLGGVSGVNDAIGAIRVPTTGGMSDGSFAPWISSSTLSFQGFRQHLAIGAVRGSQTWANSGVFIAVGDNDNRSTENFRFLNGGKIEYHKEGTTPPVATFLSTINTTVDANGFIKAASPIIRLFADKIELNDEAKQQDIVFEKLGVGDYLVKNSSGFAQDGWYVETPKDANGNVLFSVIYTTLENGDISVKTYKKKFDFETVSIVADLDNPVDITENRWIDLRLQELPQPEIEISKTPADFQPTNLAQAVKEALKNDSEQ